MVGMPSEAVIHCSAETIFDLIIDFHSQDRWLTKSSAFHGTNEVSSNPVTFGTTYREPGPFGVRNGLVTEFVRPTKVTFHQPMTLRLGLGTLDVTVMYTLTRGKAVQRDRHLAGDYSHGLIAIDDLAAQISSVGTD